MRKFSVKRGGVGLAVATAALLVGATGVAAYPVEPTPAITPTSSTQTPGGDFNETVTGCQAGETVTFTFNGASQDVTCEDVGDGTAIASLAAPAAPGTYNGNALLVTSNVTLPFTVTVEAATVTPTLPATGSDSNQVVPVAVGLVIAGAGLVGVATIRRRRVLA